MQGQPFAMRRKHVWRYHQMTSHHEILYQMSKVGQQTKPTFFPNLRYFPVKHLRVSSLFLLCGDAQTWDYFSVENTTEAMLLLYMNFFVQKLLFSSIHSKIFYVKRNTLPEQCKVTSLLCLSSLTGNFSMSFLNIKKKCLHIQEFPE